MRVGTRSVLFGAHQFAIHPWFVAWGWLKLHGFRRVQIGTDPHVRWDGEIFEVPIYASLWNPALWCAFFLHDIGYLGKPNMDGPEGEQHPFAGARIMRRLFGVVWHDFVLHHSRFLAKQRGARPSALCMADKFAIVLTPAWLYLPLARVTGEIDEYMHKSSAMNNTGSKYSGMNLDVTDQHRWHADMVRYVASWIAEHRDGREDTWTPNSKVAR